MKKQRWLLLLAVICLLVSMTTMVASADTVDGWYENWDGSYSYYREGQMVTNEVIELGGAYYAFDEYGIMFDDQEFWLGDSWYRAGAGGLLYANAWYETDYGTWYYYGADGKAAQDFLKINDVWYYFYSDGEMAQNAAVYSNDYEKYYAISETGDNSVELVEGWNGVFNSWYYVVDGVPVWDEVLKIGDYYYGFDWDCRMYDDEAFWCDGYYRAQAGGPLYTNAWYEDKEDGTWYYYGAEAMAAEDFIQSNGVWYYCFLNGEMAQDTIVYSNDYGKYYAINQAGNDSVALNEGWNEAFGSWYYLYNNGDALTYASYQLMEIGGERYWFEYDGKMVANEVFYCPAMGEAVATASGALLKTGWANIDGYYYYADNYYLYQYGVHEIGGYYYYFNEGRLYEIPGEYNDFYVGDGGALYRNVWRYDSTGYEYEIGWVYYGDDARKVYGRQTIDGVDYYFSNSVMDTNIVRETYDGVYVFGADGKGYKVNGWFQHPEDGRWMYADNGYLADGILPLAGGTYAFSNGYMVENSYHYAYTETTESYEPYLFGADGKLVTAPGWQIVNGHWYFVVDATGRVATGWMQSGANWYYLDPYMYSNTVFQDPEDGTYYAADNNGFAIVLVGNGWQQLRWGRVYLENNKPVVDDWRYLDNAWYYFSANGDMYTTGGYTIQDVKYIFDDEGKLATGGWYRIYDSWYYTEATGVPVTGLQTIDGVQYLFNDWGALYYNGVHYYEGEKYWLAADGAVLAKVQEGWNSIGGKWYYQEDNVMLRNCLREINGVRYGFGSDYAMCAGGICYAWYDYYMFDDAGVLLTGWQYIDGKWHYANPKSNDPLIYWGGIYWIDDERYYFENGSMCVGSFYSGGAYITTNAGGVVTDVTELQNGWNYTGSGYVYLKNDMPYTGWVGDYYVRNGQMLFEQKLEYAGKYYYLGADGAYVRNGWYETASGNYVYARADGTLYCSEWLYLNGVYYYFSDAWMVSDCICEINGKMHEFNADGVWIGEVTAEVREYASMSDGWHQIGGKWYYYHANTRQFGIRYINGVWYAFSGEDGAMVTNDFYGRYYYDASGARAAYTGWQYLKGYWFYFDADHSTYDGWVKSGNGWYYTAYYYDEVAEKEYVVMQTNIAIVVNRRLYHFDATGYCSGPANGTGWYQVGNDWYYLENGYVVIGTEYEIGGKLYYFGYDGVMRTNDYAYVDTATGYGYKYFGADGVAVEAAGWILWTYEFEDGTTESEWLYVGADGFLYDEGIYMIGGVQYTFRDCFMA